MQPAYRQSLVVGRFYFISPSYFGLKDFTGFAHTILDCCNLFVLRYSFLFVNLGICLPRRLRITVRKKTTPLPPFGTLFPSRMCSKMWLQSPNSLKPTWSWSFIPSHLKNRPRMKSFLRLSHSFMIHFVYKVYIAF